MEMQRRVVLRLNAGDHHVFLLAAGLINQRHKQGAAKPFSLVIGVYVDRMRDGMAKAVEGAPVAKG